MPRDLQPDKERLSPLERTGDPYSSMASSIEEPRQSPMDADLEAIQSQTQSQQVEAIKHLHPYAALLGLGDVESCVKLEEATFPEHKRASREKVGELFLSSIMVRKV